MELYLIRHGIATEQGIDEVSKDCDRTLTKQGRQKTWQVAQRLYQLGLRFDLILTSPLVRSRQTAEILCSSGLSSQLEIHPFLAPDGDIYTWLGWLEQQQHSTPHAPSIGWPSTQLGAVGRNPCLGRSQRSTGLEKSRYHWFDITRN